MFPRLGVNVDHVATLRQQRGEDYPSVALASKIALENGADQITIHLREDRRHIQDFDLIPVQEECRMARKLLNLEMGCTDEMIDIAIKLRSDWVCLVPEKRQERTTEGGLDVKTHFSSLKLSLDKLKNESSGTKISLFVEADIETLNKCRELNVNAVEIHTGAYAKDFQQKKDYFSHLKTYCEAHAFLKNSGIGFHAGHGLTDKSLLPLLELGLFEEYNIGHWIISESVFSGLGPVTKNLFQMMKKYQLKG